MDETNDIEQMRAELAELRAQASEQSERLARYEGAGTGDVLAAIERMEQKLTPPPSKEEQRILNYMERTGSTREQAEAAIKNSDSFWGRKRKRENW